MQRNDKWKNKRWSKSTQFLLRGCRVTIGEVKGETFMEVIETLDLGDWWSKCR